MVVVLKRLKNTCFRAVMETRVVLFNMEVAGREQEMVSGDGNL